MTLCDPKACSMPGFLVLHYLLQFAQTHVHQVGDAFQPPHPLSSPSSLALNLFQHQSLLQSVGSSQEGGGQRAKMWNPVSQPKKGTGTNWNKLEVVGQSEVATNHKRSETCPAGGSKPPTVVRTQSCWEGIPSADALMTYSTGSQVATLSKIQGQRTWAPERLRSGWCGDWRGGLVATLSFPPPGPELLLCPFLVLWLCVRYSDSCSETQGWRSFLCSLSMRIGCYSEKHQALRRSPERLPRLPLLLSMTQWSAVRVQSGAVWVWWHFSGRTPSHRLPCTVREKEPGLWQDSSSVSFSRQMS